ncbi:MAG: YdbH domain-containing protein [Candidatus Omnitrophica bacterium]|nr:YdbH domain-containing protein [Candidatus Omnitrophota bacterium]
MRKKIIISLIVIITVLLLAKDHFLKMAIGHYFNKKLEVESSIGQLKLSFDSLIIEDAKLSNKDFFIQLPYFKLSFNLLEIFKVKKLKIATREVSFNANNESLFFEGIFSGNFILRLDRGSIKKFNGELINETGGTIRIEKEDSLKALRGHLDQASYQTLIDGFKNYHYSRGQITMTKKADSLLIDFQFSSTEAGERNLVVDLHDIFR